MTFKHELVQLKELNTKSSDKGRFYETPEGQSVGVVKNLSYMTHITIPTESSSLYQYISPHIKQIDENTYSQSKEHLFNSTKVFINGCWYGITDDPIKLFKMLKEMKYKGIINIYTSIIFDYNKLEIRVCNDGGRLTRPVLRVKNNKLLFDNNQPIQNHNVNVSGGSEDITYNVTLGFFEQKGLQINADFNRFNVRANTVYEKNNYFGGHSNTINVKLKKGSIDKLSYS